jgi:hypothetical protein
MSDPNATYKRGFQELTELLGRTPIASDKGWVELSEGLRKSYLPAEETVLAPRARETQCVVRECVPGTSDQTDSTNVVNVGKSSIATNADSPGPMTTTTRARSLESPDRPLTNPGAAADGREAESSPEAPSAAPRIYEGDRGPNGGLMGKCLACGRLWERPKSKGRPSFKCGECR